MPIILSEDIEAMRRAAFQDRNYTGLCEVTVEEIADSGGEEDLPGFLSLKVTGSTLMEDVTYRVVDFKGDADSTLIVQVTGRVNDVIAELVEAQTS